ncbi:MAG: hypothetical protein ACYDHW_06675, partial [Syntrophorhabdaceae bacterium]
VVKPQPPGWIDDFGFNCFTPKGSISGRGYYEGELAEKFIKMPYLPGDTLWVRETWSADSTETIYRATHDGPPFGGKWRPSIFMPRKFSRITLDVTGVRVERLQEITEGDATKEGCTPSFLDEFENVWPQPFYRWGFRKLWDSINGKKYPWKDNPFVWVIEFKKAEAR